MESQKVDLVKGETRMTTWEEIRDEIAGMLADGQPLEDVIGKLEKRKNEIAKANLLKAMDDMKKPKTMTNEEYLKSLGTEQLAKRLHDSDVYAFFVCKNGGKVPSVEHYAEWLKQPHK